MALPSPRREEMKAKRRRRCVRCGGRLTRSAVRCRHCRAVSLPWHYHAALILALAAAGLFLLDLFFFR